MRQAKIIISLIFYAAPFLCLSGEGQPRYVSLAPATTEILFALGMDKEIVGVSSYCNYPPEAKGKEKTGDFSNPSSEKILSLRPDYVFCAGLEQSAAIAELRRLGLKVYVSDPANIEELLYSIEEIGAITKKEAEAKRLTAKIHAQINAVTAKARLLPAEDKPKVFVEIWHTPLTTAGKGSFIDELIGLAGGINIAHKVKRPYSVFSPEEVARVQPDVIILAYMVKGDSADSLRQRAGWEKLPAVRLNKVYADINPDIILRPGPRVAEALQELYERIHRQ
jgi:iron complex transport system substrate-binding protein